jgi:DNA-binding MarR family transcriptional regulator
MAATPDRLRRELVATSRAEGAPFNSPAGRAWETFLRAHASLTRTLDTELRRDAQLSLADFDVLIQLALADGATLRMSELARRTLVSRSGTTRRVEQLERSGLVERLASVADRRSVTVCLKSAGVEALRRALPIHARGIANHFASRLGAEEAEQLRATLEKVALDCDFG